MDLTKLVFLLVLVCSIPVFHAYAQLDDKPPQGILRSGIVGVKYLMLTLELQRKRWKLDQVTKTFHLQ